MRIAIIGTGGIGAPLGASLARAGQDVVFVARGAHLTAMRANGLRVEGDRGEMVIRPVEVTEDPSSLGPVDLVLFYVKLWDVEKAGNHIRSLIGGDTVVIPLQNGIDASERLAPILGAAHVLGGVALVSGSIVAPGVIRQTGTHHGMVFGEDRRSGNRARRAHPCCLPRRRDRRRADRRYRERALAEVRWAGRGQRLMRANAPADR
jgi:2-dehydropantoate 2-reductase